MTDLVSLIGFWTALIIVLLMMGADDIAKIIRAFRGK